MPDNQDSSSKTDNLYIQQDFFSHPLKITSITAQQSNSSEGEGLKHNSNGPK